jgi:hypothetical protein
MELPELFEILVKHIKEPPSDPKSDSTVASAMVGKYAIIRSRNEGINAGEIVEADHTGVILKNARRLWHHAPKVTTESWYEGVANHGLSEDSRVSGTVQIKAIIEDYSATLCTDFARYSIESATPNAQS